jgi:hypothetical protein
MKLDIATPSGLIPPGGPPFQIDDTDSQFSSQIGDSRGAPSVRENVAEICGSKKSPKMFIYQEDQVWMQANTVRELRYRRHFKNSFTVLNGTLNRIELILTHILVN